MFGISSMRIWTKIPKTELPEYKDISKIPHPKCIQNQTLAITNRKPWGRSRLQFYGQIELLHERVDFWQHPRVMPGSGLRKLLSGWFHQELSGANAIGFNLSIWVGAWFPLKSPDPRLLGMIQKKDLIILGGGVCVIFGKIMLPFVSFSIRAEKQSWISIT